MLLEYKIFRSTAVVIAFWFAGNVSADKLHDPTKPKFVMTQEEGGQEVLMPATTVAEEQEFPTEDVKLQGVFNRKGRTVAIISGKSYAVGDTISGYKITRINQDNIVLIGSGKQKRLYVYE